MIDLVVARYKEDISWLNEIHQSVDRIFVYDKSSTELKLSIPNAKVIPLPNVGRESDTMLNHIILNYSKLGDSTIFVQGRPFDHCPNIVSLLSFAREGIGSIGMANKRYCKKKGIGTYAMPGLCCLGLTWMFDCRLSSHILNWDRYGWFSFMFDLFNTIYGVPAMPAVSVAGWGAQLAVSKELIRRFKKDDYQKIKKYHDKSYFAPWGMEKYWLYMFYSNKDMFMADYKIEPFMLA